MFNRNNEVEIDRRSLPTAMIALLGCARPTAKAVLSLSSVSHTAVRCILICDGLFADIFPEKDTVRIGHPIL